jgi:hypothetical protein
VEKAEALVYIYTNSHFLRQRPGTDPVHYYDNNIFSEDSDDDGGAFLEMDDDNNDDNDNNNDNNGNGGEGHDGNDGNASGGGGEYRREDPSVNPGNLHHEGVYDWNEINKEMANGVDEHAVVGSIGNMHVDEDALVGSAKCGYDQTNEELDDDDYDEVANEHC